MSAWEQLPDRSARWRVATLVAVVAIVGGVIGVVVRPATPEDLTTTAPDGRLDVVAPPSDEPSPATAMPPLPPVAWPAARSGQWRRLPPAPLTSRVGHALVTAGDRVLVWGGFDRFQRPLLDGAAFDAKTGTWQRLPDNDADDAGAQAVWTGAEAVFVSSTETRRYDVVARRWRTAPAVPVPRGHLMTKVLAAGWQVVVLTEAYARDQPPAAFALRPGASRWRRLPTLPITPTVPYAALTAGRVLTVIDTAGGGNDQPVAVQLDVGDEASRWSRIPPPPAPDDGPLRSLVGSANDDGIVVWGSRPSDHYAAATTVGGRWRRLDGGPLVDGRAASGVWTGSRLAVWDRAVNAGALLDPTSGQWTPVPPPPIPLFQPRPVVWTGNGLLMWGGLGSSGAIYTP